MNRPFVYGYLAEKENFIDRTEDRKKLKNFLQHGINVMLISPRRWGKSSLVKMAMEELKKEDKDILVCHIDAFKIHNETDFYNAYASAVVNGIASNTTKGIELIKKYLMAITPTFKIKSDPLNTIEVNLNFQTQSKSVEDILNLPEIIAESRKKHVIICIDEFQQLATLPQWKSMEGLLRSIWQQHQNVNYCLYGSKRHMMMDIFNNSNNPFYRFGQVFFLQKIAKEYWIPYIISSFAKSGKTISSSFAERICDTVECHSWYVQQLSFFVWSDTTKEVTEEIFNRQIQTLIDTNAPLYEQDLDGMVPSQIAMLTAISNNENHLNASDVVKRYELGAPQTVTRNKRVLEARDIIEKQGNDYHFVDPVFRLWFIREHQ